MAQEGLQIRDHNIYLHVDGQDLGPLTRSEVHELFKEKKIDRSTPLWFEGLTNWIRVGDMPEYDLRKPPDLPPLEIPPLPSGERGEGRLCVYQDGRLLFLSVPDIKGLIQKKDFRRADRVYSREEKKWVRADHHPETKPLFSKPATEPWWDHQKMKKKKRRKY